jgi:hypothetical protein
MPIDWSLSRPTPYWEYGELVPPWACSGDVWKVRSSVMIVISEKTLFFIISGCFFIIWRKSTKKKRNFAA